MEKRVEIKGGQIIAAGFNGNGAEAEKAIAGFLCKFTDTWYFRSCTYDKDSDTFYHAIQTGVLAKSARERYKQPPTDTR